MGFQQDLVDDPAWILAVGGGLGGVVVDMVGLGDCLVVFQREQALCWPAGRRERNTRLKELKYFTQ